MFLESCSVRIKWVKCFLYLQTADLAVVNQILFLEVVELHSKKKMSKHVLSEKSRMLFCKAKNKSVQRL